MQLRPGENFVVVRQLDDPFDSGTYYVQAKIRDARTDELIATLNLQDQGSQRFTSPWVVAADSSGLGRYIDIETMVYTDSGYSTISEVYRRENSTFLIEERASVSLGGGSDIDYKKVKAIFDEILTERSKGSKKDSDAIKENTEARSSEIKKAIEESTEAIRGVVEGVVGEIKDAIEGAKPDLSPIVEAVGTAKGEVVSAIADKEVTPVTDLTPVIEKLDSMTLKDYQEEAQKLIEQVREIIGSDFVKMFKALSGIREFLNAIPFIVMNGSERKKIEEVEEVSELPKRQRNIRTRGFAPIGAILGIAFVVLAGGYALSGPYQWVKEQFDDEKVEVDNQFTIENGEVDNLNVGDTQGSLNPWVATTSGNAITQRVNGKAIKITGLNDGCLSLSGKILTSSGSACGGSGAGSGTISTSTAITTGTLAFFNSGNTIASVATGTLTENITGLSFDATRGVVGGSAVLSIDSGYELFKTASGTNWNAFYDAPSNRITAGTGIDWSSNTLNVTLADFTTANLSENTNLYYTDARVSSYLYGSTTRSNLFTAGDALTWSGTTINFDGGNTPSGDLGGTWASPSVTDDSHAHTGSTLSGIDISSDTNLSADGTEIVLTGDALSLGNTLSFTYASTTGESGTNLNYTNATIGTLTLTNDLTVANGGTGASTLTGILLGNGASAFTALTTSSGVFGAISDETGGTGVLVGSAGPTFTGQTNFAVASGTSMGLTGNAWLTYGSSTGFTSTRIFATDATSTTSFFSGLGTFTNMVVNTLATFLNVTITGLLDIGGGVLEIPNGTNPTANDVGEIAHDTTDNQLIMDDWVIPVKTELFMRTIASSSVYYATSSSWYFPTLEDGYVVTDLNCKVKSGTSKPITMFGETLTCDTNGEVDDGSIAIATVGAGSTTVMYTLGAGVGAVDEIIFSVYGYKVRE